MTDRPQDSIDDTNHNDLFNDVRKFCLAWLNVERQRSGDQVTRDKCIELMGLMGHKLFYGGSKQNKKLIRETFNRVQKATMSIMDMYPRISDEDYNRMLQKKKPGHPYVRLNG